MLASTRRTLRTSPALVAFAALSLGLAACGGDDAAEPDETEVEAPADDGLDEGADGPATDPDDPAAAPPAFEGLEDGELVPGVYMDVPVDESLPVQAQPTPVGSAYVAAMTDQTGAVSLNVEFDGPGIDELLTGIDDLVETGQAEVTDGPEDVDVEGADEAVRVEVSAPQGGASATALFAVADGHAISIAIEVTDESDIDVEEIVDSLRIDADRIEMAGTAELPDGTDPDATDGAADGTDPDAETGEVAPEDETDDQS